MFMIYPYSSSSAGAKAIAAELEGLRIKREGSTYKEKPEDVIINWGASDCPFPSALNYGSTKELTNKISFFEILKGEGITPRFTTSREAAEFMTFPVFCRQKVEGKDGEGIVVARTPEELVSAKLYVEGVQKKREYRVHVGRHEGVAEVIGAQQKYIPDPSKLADPDVWAGDACNFVWTVNGYDVVLPDSVREVVMKAFGEFPGLTFAAFDVALAEDGRAVVFEANTAPAVTPKTAEKYAAFFRKFEKVPEVAPTPLEPAPASGLWSLKVTFDPNTVNKDDLIHATKMLSGVITVEA